MKDPAYLAHLGEFASLKNAIGSWYHMDAYFDFETDEQIWAEMSTSMSAEEIGLVASQIADLLERSDDEVLSTWNNEAFSHNFSGTTDARKFLRSMLEYLRRTKK